VRCAHDVIVPGWPEKVGLRVTVPMRTTRWSIGARVAAVVLLMVHALLAWSFRVPGLSSSADDAAYLALARALRSGSYAELWTAGGPTHAMYPPGYPALLALVGATGPAQVQLAVGLSVLLSVAALALATVLAGRVAPWLAVAVLAVCAPNPMLVDLAGRIYSEPLFMVLTLATVLLLTADAPTTRTRALAGAAALAASLTRSIGVVLVMAVLAEWAMQRRWRAVLVLAGIACVTVVSWLIWTVQAPRRSAGSSYIADAMHVPVRTGTTTPGLVDADGASGSPRLSETDDTVRATTRGMAGAVATLAVRVRQQTSVYLTRTIPSALAQPTVPGTPIDNALGFVVLLVAGGLGFGQLIRRQRMTAIHLAAYAGVLLVWPYASGRFVAPVLPLLVLMLLLGIWSAGGRWHSPRTAWFGVWLVAGMYAVGALRLDAARWAEVSPCDRTADSWRDPSCASARQREFRAAVDTAAKLAKPGSPLLTSKAATVFLLSGRVSVVPDTEQRGRDPDAFIAALRTQQVDVVILSQMHFAQWGLSPMLSARCGAFALLASFGPHTKVLRLLPGNTPPNDLGAACAAIRSWASGDWVADVEQARAGVW